MLRDFTKRQRKILDLILRLSWGCGKKIAHIPRQRDFTVIGIAESHISAELNWLAESKVIFINGSYYSFNKDFDQWQVSRVKPYDPENLTKLVRLNLNWPHQNSKAEINELNKTASKNLPKQKISTYQNSKFSTPELASPKENAIERYKERDVYTGLLDITVAGEERQVTAAEFWQLVLTDLKRQVTAANYQTWLGESAALGIQDGFFVVSLPSSYVMEHLAQTQRSLIERALAQYLGYRIRVEFVVRQPEVVSP